MIAGAEDLAAVPADSVVEVGLAASAADPAAGAEPEEAGSLLNPGDDAILLDRRGNRAAVFWRTQLDAPLKEDANLTGKALSDVCKAAGLKHSAVRND